MRAGSYLRVRLLAQQCSVKPAQTAGSGLRSLEVKYCCPAKELLRLCASHTGKQIIFNPRTVLVLLFLEGITVCDFRGSKMTSPGHYLLRHVNTHSLPTDNSFLDAGSFASIAAVNLCHDLKHSTERLPDREAVKTLTEIRPSQHVHNTKISNLGMEGGLRMK